MTIKFHKKIANKNLKKKYSQNSKEYPKVTLNFKS